MKNKTSLPFVSVIIVNYNGKKFLRKCLASLSSINYPKNKIEIILVDNCSNDSSVSYIKKYFRKIKLIENKDNNYCRANNKAINFSKGEYIAFLNNDTKVHKNWLIEMVKVITLEDKIGAVGSKLLFMNGLIQSVGHDEHPNFYWVDRGFEEKDKGQYDQIREVFSICGCSALYRKKCLKNTGFMDEDFEMYLEDVDLGIRARNKGWKLFICPGSIVYHELHGTIENESSAKFFQERNRLLLIAKHWPDKLPDAIAGREYFTKNIDYVKTDAICDILSSVYKKLVSIHGAKFASLIYPELFRSVRKVFYSEKDFLVQTIVAKDKDISLINMKLKDIQELKKKQEIKFIEDLNILRQELSSKANQLEDLKSKTVILKQELVKSEAIAQEHQFKQDTLRQDIIRKEEQIKAIEHRHVEKLAGLKKRKKEELSLLAAQKEQELSAKNQELAFTKQQLDSSKQEIDSLKQKFTEELSSLAKAKDNEISSLRQQKESELAWSMQKYIQEIKLKDDELSICNQQSDFLKQELSFLKETLIKKEGELALLSCEFSRNKEATSLLTNQLNSLREAINEARKKYEEMLAEERLEKEKNICSAKEQIQERDERIKQLTEEKEYLGKEKDKWQFLCNRIRLDLDAIYNSTGYRWLLKPLWKILWPIKQNIRKTILRFNFLFKSFKPRIDIKQCEYLITQLASNIKKIRYILLGMNKNKRVYLDHIEYATFPSFPHRLTLMVTSLCNLKCQFCDVPNWQHRRTVLPKEDAFKIIDSVSRLGVRELILTGGEPFLHPYLFDIIREARARGMQVIITTNGLLIKQHIDALVSSHVDCVSVSIDGKESTHDSLRNHPGAYREATEAMALLKARGISVSVNFVVTKKNVFELDSQYIFFSKQGIKLSFFPVVNKPELFPCEPKEQRAYYLFINKLLLQRRISFREYRFLRLAMDVYFTNDNNVRCLGLFNELGIDTDGNVSPCCVWENKRAELNNIGNALTQDLEELWFSPSFHKIRRLIFQEGCKNCYNPSIIDCKTIVRLPYIISRRSSRSLRSRLEKKDYAISSAKPNHVHMRFTTRCDLSCRHCDMWKIDVKKNREISIVEWKICIDKLCGWLGSFRLDLAGGEILLYKDAPELIRYCAANGIMVNLTTNSMCIDQMMAEHLVQSGLYCINLSLDGLKDVHGYTRNRADAFAKVEEAAKHLIKLRALGVPKVSITTVITGKNIDQLPELIKLPEKWGVDNLSFQALDHRFGAPYVKDWFRHNEFWPSDFSKIKDALQKLIAAKKSGIPIDNSYAQLEAMKKYYKNPHSFSREPCLTGINNFIVNEAGEVLLCWNMPPVGNLAQEDPERIWRSKSANKMKKIIMQCRRTCRILNCNYS